MRFLALVNGDADGSKVRGKVKEPMEVEQQMLATNPILQAFGNAQTTRHDNSSRLPTLLMRFLARFTCLAKTLDPRRRFRPSRQDFSWPTTFRLHLTAFGTFANRNLEWRHSYDCVGELFPASDGPIRPSSHIA